MRKEPSRVNSSESLIKTKRVSNSELHQSCVLILSGNFYFLLQNLCTHNKLDLQWWNQVSANYRMYDSVRVLQINCCTQIGSANQLVYPNCSGAGTAHRIYALSTRALYDYFLGTWINFSQLCMQHENCWYTWQKSNSIGNMEKLTMTVIWKKFLVKLYTDRILLNKRVLVLLCDMMKFSPMGDMKRLMTGRRSSVKKWWELFFLIYT